MKDRKIGNIEVSPVGMGCMGFSHGYGTVPEEGYAIGAIRAAHDFRCTFFDTAESYGKEMFYPGHNEQLVGKAVEPFRKEVTLATKFHIEPQDALSGGDLYEDVQRHLEASMKNLRTDYIDLYYLHRINERVPVEAVAEVMQRFISKGLIRGWGLSQVSAATLDKANQVCPVTAVQNIYNILERDCEEDIFPYCLKHHIGVVPFSPVASGFLSGKVTIQTKFKGDDVRKFIPQLMQENIVANQPILNVLKKFSELETALNSCTIHGHRGHVETEQTNFGKNWENKF